ncbi:unnamed protein product [Prorocentrum cordatum]|uniref:Uncharacterized protein n=1 Tax=Prorocentrum cordatum TaxID=2364126 RepID=A0ABN9UDP9_9DINO|nr:unnamed protein product [Polarella glacialis]
MPAPATITPQFWDKYFGVDATCETAFEGLTGSRLWKELLVTYCTERHSTLQVLGMRTGADGKYTLLLKRCPDVNPRKQCQIVKEYAKTLMDKGLFSEMRGQPIAVETGASCADGDCLMIAGATLCEACKVAADIDTTNVYIQDIIRDVMSNIMVFRRDCPKEIQRAVKKMHNKFHSGSDATFVELFELVDEAEKTWAARKKAAETFVKVLKAERITVTSCPKSGDYRYEKLYERYVLSHFDQFKTWDHYDNCKSFTHKMHAAKLYTPWKEEMEQRCEFLDRGITNKLVAKVCNTLFLRIMDFSDAVAAPPVKKPKKGTQDEALVLNVPAEEIHDTVSADSPSTSRNTLFFDDLVNAICQPLQHLPIARYNAEVIRELFKFGFIFCFEGAVTIRGEMYTDWSKVRKIFRDDSIRAHRGDLMVKECEIAHGDADAGAASSFAGPSVGSVQAVNDALSQFVGDEKFVLGMFAIVRQTKMPDILVQPAYLNVSMKLYQQHVEDVTPKGDAAAAPVAWTHVPFLECARRVLKDTFSHRWTEFGTRLLPIVEKGADDSNISHLTVGLFDTKAHVRRFFGLRASCVIGTLANLGCIAAPSAIQALYDNISMIKERDLAVKDDRWVAMWSVVINAAMIDPDQLRGKLEAMVVVKDQAAWFGNDADAPSSLPLSDSCGSSPAQPDEEQAKTTVAEAEVPKDQATEAPKGQTKKEAEGEATTPKAKTVADPAAGSSTAASGGKTTGSTSHAMAKVEIEMTLTAIASHMACSEVGAPVLASFMKHLGAFIYDTIKMSKLPSVDVKSPTKRKLGKKTSNEFKPDKAPAAGAAEVWGDFADAGLDLIKAKLGEPDSKEKPELVATEITPSICLHFYGAVTRALVKDALHVCSAFGIDFYITKEGVDTFHSQLGFCPAWMVNVKQPKEKTLTDGSKKLEPPTVNLNHKKETTSMHYTYSHMGKTMTVHIPVTIHSLVTLNQSKQAVKKGATTAKGAPEEFKGAKHLYR